MSDNQEILNISELYGYDDKNLPDSAYPIRYHNIYKAQKTDAKLNQKLVSHKDYTLNTFCVSDQNHSLIFWNIKIFLPAELQKKNVDLYHKMLCHTGDTQTEHTLCQHFYCKGLRTTVHDVCKKCPNFQRKKTTNQKYGELTPEQTEPNPWYRLCVNLIGPYKISQKGKNPLKLWCLIMINSAIGWFNIAQITNKTVA